MKSAGKHVNFALFSPSRRAAAPLRVGYPLTGARAAKVSPLGGSDRRI
ncbi:MAG TPA: hypothetical protein VEZ11_00675 [Thermoanaerobaculia bacterium]|nr:hypothetical protein [Thermoanaerobaculia bacterium]